MESSEWLKKWNSNSKQKPRIYGAFFIDMIKTGLIYSLINVAIDVVFNQISDTMNVVDDGRVGDVFRVIIQHHENRNIYFHDCMITQRSGDRLSFYCIGQSTVNDVGEIIMNSVVTEQTVKIYDITFNK